MTKDEIYNIIDKAIKTEQERKQKYIELNGFKHKDILDRFATRIAMLTECYTLFKDA